MIVGVDASRANLLYRTGTEWYAYHIIRQLVTQHRDAQWVLYTPSPLLPDLAPLVGPTVVSRVLPWRGPLWSQLRLSGELLRRPPDVLFEPAHTIPFWHPRATVTTIHDVGFERAPDLYAPTTIAGSRGLRRWAFEAIVRLVTAGRYGNRELDYHRYSVRQALAVGGPIITVSEFSARELTATLGVDPQRVVVIPHGFDPTEVAPAWPKQRIQATFGVVRPFFLFVGRLERKKGIDLLARAYAALIQRRATAPDLVLVGSPGYGFADTAPLWERAGARVHRLPWQTAERLSALFHAARAFVFPSRYEGFGLPLLTAFAHGTPTVITAQGALQEVGGRAVLVAKSEAESLSAALDRVDRDEPLRQTLTRFGRERLRRYRWDAAADQTMAVLRTAAASASVAA